MCEVSIVPVVKQIEIMFEDFNQRLFESALSKPVITVNSDNSNRANSSVLGWCTSWQAWKDSEDNGYYEINISCDYLDRGIAENAETLVHEMVHLYCVQNGIKDTSRAGTYHNKKYKEVAEAHGMIVAFDKKRGWTVTKLNDEMAKYVNEKYSDVELAYNGMVSGGGEKKKSSTRKYTCPSCGVTVRATKEVKIVCYECDVLMFLENND